MATKKFKKEDFIRELLMKTVGKSPDLFSYYVNLQEAKELLGKNTSENSKEIIEKPKRIIIDC
jgi:hypothetical protein